MKLVTREPSAQTIDTAPTPPTNRNVDLHIPDKTKHVFGGARSDPGITYLAQFRPMEFINID